MSWTETMGSQQVTRDVENHRRGVRIYRIWGSYPRTQILGDPRTIINSDGIGLPDYGSPWEGMFLDAYDVAAVGNIWDATALYSTDGRFRFPPPPPPLDSGSWHGSIQSTTVNIPVAKLVTNTVTTMVQNGPPIVTPVSGYVFQEQPTLCTVHRIGQQVILNYPTFIAAKDASLRQMGKMHKILGRWYRFEGGDYVEEAAGKWRMSYNWISDPGTKRLEGVDSNPFSIVWPGGGFHGGDPDFEWPVGSGDFWVRPPFHVIVPVPNDVANVPPSWHRMLPYDSSDALGWGTLPGFLP